MEFQNYPGYHAVTFWANCRNAEVITSVPIVHCNELINRLIEFGAKTPHGKMLIDQQQFLGDKAKQLEQIYLESPDR